MRISDWSSDVCSSDLLQENRLRQALAPYVLGGPHGRLLDAECESLGEGEVRAFEMEQLMHARGAVLPVLTYLFHRLERRFDGAPTLLVLDEAWNFLDDPLFAGRIREWQIGGASCRESVGQYG